MSSKSIHVLLLTRLFCCLFNSNLVGKNRHNSISKLFKRISVLSILLLFSVNAISQTTTFTDNKWAPWSNGSQGNQLLSNRGVQVTASTSEAYANSLVRYTNIESVEVIYSTNTSSGAGTINIFSVDSSTAQKENGTRIGNSETVNSSGGISDRLLTFTPSELISGYVQIYVTCSSNSIYIKSVKINVQSCSTPIITIPSINTTVLVGNTATFSATVSGTVTNYQWQVLESNSDVWANITGANSLTYTLSCTTSSLSYNRYRLVASNTATCTSISAEILLVVTVPPGNNLISFNPNGGYGCMPDVLGSSNSNVILPSNQFYKDGSIFIGWNTMPNGAGTSYSNQDEFILSSPITVLYAQWQVQSKKYELISNVDKLESGIRYLIVNSAVVGNALAMGAQNTNNRTTANVQILSGVDTPNFISVLPSDINSNGRPFEFELQAISTIQQDWKIKDVNGGYLYPTDGQNYLRNSTSENNNYIWSITFSDNSAIIQSSVQDRKILFNINTGGSPLFSAYGTNTSVNGPIYLYKERKSKLIASISELNFGSVCYQDTDILNFTLEGSYLSSGIITINPLEGYLFSESPDGEFTSNFIFSHPEGDFSKTIYVKFTRESLFEDYNGNILISDGGFTQPINISVIGGLAANIVVTKDIYCDKAVLSVNDSSENALSYKWYVNDGVSSDWNILTENSMYSGVNTGVLSINSDLSLNGYAYVVEVSQSVGVCTLVSEPETVDFSSNTTIWNGSQWLPSEPSENYNVIFEGDFVSTSDFNACKLVVRSGNVVISEEDTVIVTNEVSVLGGSLTIKDNANLIQKNNSAVNTGVISVERITKPMSLSSYVYWGSPVNTKLSLVDWKSESSQGVFDRPEVLSSANFKWNVTTQSWAYQGLNDDFISGHGFIIKAPNNFHETNRKSIKATFTGVPNNGLVSVGIPGNLTGKKLVLLSNPYPSSINIDELLLTELGSSPQNIFVPTIYLWTYANNPTQNSQGIYSYSSSDYLTYNLLGSVQSCESCGVLEDLKIASGQGFFIASNQGGTIQFNNSIRYNNNSGYSNSQFYRLNQLSSTNSLSIEKHRIWLNLKDSNLEFSQTLIGYSNYATDDLDALDGKYIGAGKVKLYSNIADEKYAIKSYAMPFENTDALPLTIEVSDAGQFVIELERFENLFVDQNIYIKDNYTGVIHDLKSGEYSFVSDSGIFNDRFQVVFINETMSVGQLNNLDFKWIIYPSEGGNIIKSVDFEIKDVFVYDLLGREVYSKKNINSSEYKIQNLAVNQVLLVKVISVDNKISVKKISN